MFSQLLNNNGELGSNDGKRKIMFSQDRPNFSFHEDERDALGNLCTLNHIGEILVIICDDDGVIFVFIFQELNLMGFEIMGAQAQDTSPDVGIKIGPGTSNRPLMASLKGRPKTRA